MDVREIDQITAAVDAVVARFGRLDILVNNAGLGPPNPAEQVTEADFDLTLAVNVKGVFFASQAAGQVMIGQGFGRIVSLSSQAGFVALPTESVYCLSKAAVAHLTKCLAVEWGRHGITVNAVAPTFIRTPGTEKWLRDEAFVAETVERIAGVHRIGEPMDVAGAVVFLASPAASLVTGTTLMVDGGWTAR
jgi:NAD(P)-dependent dehydrogenase (short-subunit alcohol dehydrogenase family)